MGVKVAAAVGVSWLPVTRSARCDAALCRSGTAPLRLSAGRNTCCVQGHSVKPHDSEEPQVGPQGDSLSLSLAENLTFCLVFVLFFISGDTDIRYLSAS